VKAALKTLALRGLTTGPAYGVLRAKALKSQPVTILCYHTLRPDAQQFDAWVALRKSDFLAQMEMLRGSYDIVSLDDALAPAPPGARPRAVLTFDDGEIGLFDHLLPIVQAKDIPVTVYIATAHIETGTAYWFDRVMNALQTAGETQIALDGLGAWQIGPARGKARWAQISAVLEALKTAPTQARDRLADQVVTQAGPMADNFTPLQPMSVPQLQELAADPRITIGAHSHGHELLDQLPTKEAKASIARSRDLLVAWTGREIRHFAYPNGNYTPELMNALDALGFASATILEDRLVQKDAPAQALPRIGIGRYDPLARLKLRLVGL
jgi:peptidoglycan/xylan/chitin deacetylase (PgdA/CDA1 family)